ncbi:hypothetical protein [Sulfolobus acidocaldarius]|uniref:Uncharacterized protein n=3 Tax=Sulfolobus acidocaldarius TaxID=2285 RepID=A0A0U2Y5I1_9CREN|nr:hypothetical protein [Sulfolobus acidocaldarius]AGE71629.1 hypothetical protein SacN8_08345 [Sulfolobus acidocaldarius N8]AGE73903.1 hypothetical protein SacRon12I_08360 [Sulfolobus acidocaldarius Ron12/I]ALU30155.1 hypothetical protein ATY89_09540 [Sulfolobus acidocaldarius]ALU30849.1 hypothetical protein ATZ20_00950 [Sulfolobus acidocaldarius]WCM35532.1 hypothetical protein GO597_09420 [Sulfolobus acidocaldarius DSM 639]
MIGRIIKAVGGQESKVKSSDWKVDLAVILGAIAVMGVALAILAIFAPEIAPYYQQFPPSYAP